MSEEDLIRLQLQNLLDELVGSKIQPTATAIMSARQPIVLLFEELMYKLNKLQKEIEKYKRLAKANLKDSQEFQDNMCNHRCIKNNEVLELKAEIEKKDKVIDLMAEDIYDNDNFWKLKCAFEKIENGKEKDYIKERFFEKAEE